MYGSDFIQAFGSSGQYQSFVSYTQGSSLLTNLLNQFSGSIRLTGLRANRPAGRCVWVLVHA
jgi:hypothetical protein